MSHCSSPPLLIPPSVLYTERGRTDFRLKSFHSCCSRGSQIGLYRTRRLFSKWKKDSERDAVFFRFDKKRIQNEPLSPPIQIGESQLGGNDWRVILSWVNPSILSLDMSGKEPSKWVQERSLCSRMDVRSVRNISEPSLMSLHPDLDFSLSIRQTRPFSSPPTLLHPSHVHNEKIAEE